MLILIIVILIVYDININHFHNFTQILTNAPPRKMYIPSQNVDIRMLVKTCPVVTVVIVVCPV